MNPYHKSQLSILAYALLSFNGFWLAGCTETVPEHTGLLSINLERVDFVTQSEATFSGYIFGNIELVDSMGFCWGINPRPTVADTSLVIETTIGVFTAKISGFEPDNRYYARAYYYINGGIFYSNVISFDTPAKITDIQGNSYKTVKIGNQLWMAENLRTTKYNNGDNITDGTGLGNYSAIYQPRLFFNYMDNSKNVGLYGRLYTWFVIEDPRGLCPPGWAVPDIDDWQKLSVHLDGLTIALRDLGAGQKEMSSVSGGMMKASGTIQTGTGLWHEPNEGATNSSQFSVIPAGLRDPSGAFDGIGFNAAFWSITANDPSNAQMFYIHFFNSGFYTNSFNKQSGYSVRCIKRTN